MGKCPLSHDLDAAWSALVGFTCDIMKHKPEEYEKLKPVFMAGARAAFTDAVRISELPITKEQYQAVLLKNADDIVEYIKRIKIEDHVFDELARRNPVWKPPV